MTKLYILFEDGAGYCLFKVKEFEEIGAFMPQVEEAVNDSSKFMQVVNLAGFRAFKNAAAAMENMNSISKGILSQDLIAFLQTNMPNTGNKKSITLGVHDPVLGSAISEALEIPVTHTGCVPELFRGIRTHFRHFIKGLTVASKKQSSLGLSHSFYSKKTNIDVHRVDNMIIQSISLIDHLDKDINKFAIRIREWYTFHFPELAKIVTDNYEYVLCASYIKNRNLLKDEMIEKLRQITGDSEKAQKILNAGRTSMGMDISPIDLLNIEMFSKRVVGLAEYRQNLVAYLKSKMNAVAPNLSTLIGEVIGARLISHAGSLTKLAKCPASSVQVLGAEKALFKSFKTKSQAPMCGLIFNSSLSGKAALANKGKISSFIAHKCTIASRVDCFSDVQTSVFGEKLKSQVEKRLRIFERKEQKKNVHVTNKALLQQQMQEQSEVNELNCSDGENDVAEPGEPVNKGKKRKSKQFANSMNFKEESKNAETESPKKKKKKQQHSEQEANTEGNLVTKSVCSGSSSLLDGEEKVPKKKKRKGKGKNK